MLLAKTDPAETVAWIGIIGVLLTGLFGGAIAYWSNRNRTTIKETTGTLGTVTASVINLENVFEDMRVERNRARKVAEAERKRADTAEARADALERRVRSLERAGARSHRDDAAD